MWGHHVGVVSAFISILNVVTGERASGSRRNHALGWPPAGRPHDWVLAFAAENGVALALANNVGTSGKHDQREGLEGRAVQTPKHPRNVFRLSQQYVGLKVQPLLPGHGGAKWLLPNSTLARGPPSRGSEHLTDARPKTRRPRGCGSTRTPIAPSHLVLSAQTAGESPSCSPAPGGLTVPRRLGLFFTGGT